MKTIARFQVPEDAYLLRGYLQSRGIGAHVFDEHVVQLFWHYSNAIGGVRVVVGEEDEAEATALCREYMQALKAEPVLVSYVKPWPLILMMALLIGPPALVFGKRVLRFTK